MQTIEDLGLSSRPSTDDNDGWRDERVTRMIEMQADRVPDATAVVCGTQRLSYGALERRANRLAHAMRERGVGVGSLVGVSMYRSVELVVAVLAVLKSGAAYVAIDPAYPSARLNAMLTEVPLQLLLTHEASRENLPAECPEELCLDDGATAEEVKKFSVERISSHASRDDKCYVIYTSGSTGRPKAAAVLHGGWFNLMRWFTREFGVGQTDKVLVVSSFSFDITQRSIVMPLIVGAELHLLPSRHYDPLDVRRAIRQQGITIINCAPSTFYPVVEKMAPSEYDEIASLRLLFLGGEAISATRLARWGTAVAGRTSIVNVYGAAECSDVSSSYTLSDFEAYSRGQVPIGRPIDHTRLYVLDDFQRPVDDSDTGEICIAGAGVGAGYINDQELTDAHFVTDPFEGEEGRIMYRTGDLGRRLPDGNLVFVGRVDQQIKLRGIRIHLGEIENALRQLPIVKEAVAIKKIYDEQDERIVAFVTLREAESARADELRSTLLAHMQQRVPTHMVPAEFVVLADLPLSPNGKVDRNRLKDIEIESLRDVAGRRLPATELEIAVGEIFMSVLKIRSVGVDESFFDLGGYSSLLTEALALINETFAAEMSIYEFLTAPTIEGVVRRIERGER